MSLRGQRTQEQDLAWGMSCDRGSSAHGGFLFQVDNGVRVTPASVCLLWSLVACPTQCPERPRYIVCDWAFSTPSHFSPQSGLPEIILSLVNFRGVYSKPIPEPGSNRTTTWFRVQSTPLPLQPSLPGQKRPGTQIGIGRRFVRVQTLWAQ